MKHLIVIMLGTAALLSVTESASAQIFRRIWNRRKAQIRYEVVNEVTPYLEGQVEAGVAEAKDEIKHAAKEDVADAKKDLQQSAEKQVDSEAKRLSEHFMAELAKFRLEAEAVVNAESKRLESDATAKIKKMQEDAAAKVASEAKRLEAEVAKQLTALKAANQKQMEEAIAKVTSDSKQFVSTTVGAEAARLKTEAAAMKLVHDKSLAAAVKKLDEQMTAEFKKNGDFAAALDKRTKELEAAVQTSLANVPGQVTAEINKQSAKLKKELSAEIKAATPSLPTPKEPPTDPPKEPEQAIQDQPVKPVDDADDADDDKDAANPDQPKKEDDKAKDSAEG